MPVDGCRGQGEEGGPVLNPYQFFAERKKLPPVATQIIIGKVAFIIANNGRTLINGAVPVDETFWQPKSKTS